MLRKLFFRLWPIITLTVIIFAFFHRLFIPELSIFITPDYGRSDAWHLSIANKFYFAQELKNNRIPIWNPHIGTGFPTLAEGQTGVFFLPNLILFRFLPFVWAYNLSLVLTFIIAGSGAYLFARSLNLSKFASLYAGLIFPLGAFFVVHVQHLHLIQTASLLPWLFWTANEFFEKRKTLFLIYLSLFISQQIFTGFPQLTFYSLVALLIFVSLRIYLLKKSRVKLFAAVIIAIVLAFALGAVQLIPTYEFLKLSSRDSYPKQILEQFPYKPQNILQFIDPFVFGSPADGSYPRWTPREWGIFWENTAYVGILPLSLALAVTITNLKTKSKHRQIVIILAFIGLISILVSLGISSPLHPVFSFPPFSVFRVPSRFLLTFQFSLSILAAIYCQRISKKTIAVASITLISVFNLYVLFGNYNSVDSAKKWFAKPETSIWLSQNKTNKIITLEDFSLWNQYFLKSGWQKEDFYYFARSALGHNSNLIFNHDQFFAYESLITQRSAIFHQIIADGVKVENNKITLSNHSKNLLLVSNVNHIITPLEIEDRDFQKVFETKKFEDHTFKIYQTSKPPQRFFLTSNYKLAKTIPQIANLIVSEDFSKNSQVIIEEEQKINNLNLKEGSTQLIKETPTYLEFNLNLDGDGLFVLADSFYPGWKAYLDNQETPIMPANINQRAITIPAGNHEVILKYQPQSVKLGTIISVLSIVTLIIISLKYKKHKII